jgi:hypothetical protein
VDQNGCPSGFLHGYTYESDMMSLV